MTVGSWHLIGRAPTLAMVLARHCTNPFVPLLAWESPVFKFERNEKFPLSSLITRWLLPHSELD
jgi:hypothetical protein